jgi:glycosyltransferase involved in cell wall biosynthesis
MAQRVANYADHVRGPSSVTWLPLWSDGDLSPWPDAQSNPLRAERGWARDEPVFLYSGNMGLGHRFTEFLEAAQSLGPTGPRWIFCGGGKRRTEIEAFAQTNSAARIELLDYAPKTRLREHLCSADVHLMSLDPAWQGFMVPSKLQASFAVGRPVLYVGGRDCETANWIQESGGGWVVDQNDVPALLAAVAQALDPVERKKRGLAAREFALRHFSRSATCNQLAAMLEAAVASAADPLPLAKVVSPLNRSATGSESDRSTSPSRAG